MLISYSTSHRPVYRCLRLRASLHSFTDRIDLILGYDSLTETLQIVFLFRGNYVGLIDNFGNEGALFIILWSV